MAVGAAAPKPQLRRWPPMIRVDVRAVLASIVAAALLVACQSSVRVYRLEGFAQGTLYHVSFVAGEAIDPAAMQRAIDAEFAAIDRAYSNYRDDSVVERFNAAPPDDSATAPFEVGAPFVELLRAARDVHAASNGCFDPTIEPLQALWGFDSGDIRIPADADVRRARERVGLGRIRIVDNRRIEKHGPVTLDLSGIAQGDSAARVAALLEARGLVDYSVEIGGEIQVRGAKPGGRPWRIAILDPDAAGIRARVIEYALDRPLAISTSGTYRNFLDVDGRRYSHLLDPRTGHPVEHDTVSVTVAHADGARADGWSTALLCLGTEAGLDAAARHDIAALFIERDGAERLSPAWRERIGPMMRR